MEFKSCNWKKKVLSYSIIVQYIIDRLIYIILDRYIDECIARSIDTQIDK